MILALSLLVAAAARKRHRRTTPPGGGPARGRRRPRLRRRRDRGPRAPATLPVVGDPRRAAALGAGDRRRDRPRRLRGGPPARGRDGGRGGDLRRRDGRAGDRRVRVARRPGAPGIPAGGCRRPAAHARGRDRPRPLQRARERDEQRVSARLTGPSEWRGDEGVPVRPADARELGGGPGGGRPSWRDVQPGVTRLVLILSLLLVAAGPFLRRFVVRPRPTPTEPVEDGDDPGAHRLGRETSALTAPAGYPAGCIGRRPGARPPRDRLPRRPATIGTS